MGSFVRNIGGRPVTVQVPNKCQISSLTPRKAVAFDGCSDDADWIFRKGRVDRYHVEATRVSKSPANPNRASIEKLKIRLNHCSPSVSGILKKEGIIRQEYPEDEDELKRMAPARAENLALRTFFSALHERGISWKGDLDGDPKRARQILQTLMRAGVISDDVRTSCILILTRAGHEIPVSVPPSQRSTPDNLHKDAERIHALLAATEVYSMLEGEPDLPSVLQVSDVLRSEDSQDADILQEIGVSRHHLQLIRTHGQATQVESTSAEESANSRSRD